VTTKLDVPNGRYAPWILVALLWVAFFLNYADRQVAFSILPALQRDLHFTTVQLGLVGTVFIWVYSLSMPAAGRLADLFPRLLMVVASLVLWSMAMLGTGSSASVNGFLFWRAAMGVTEALYFPAAVALIASYHSVTARSRALAIHQSAQLAGGAAGGWFGGWMADNIGWQTGYRSLAWTGVVYAAVLYFALRKLPPPADAAEQKQEAASPMAVFRSLPMNLLLAAFFFHCGVLWMIYAWLPHHIYTRYGLSMTKSGLIGTLYLQSSSLVGILTGGYLGDRLRARPVVACTGLLLCSPFAYGLFAAQTLEGTIACAIGFGLTAGLMMANVFASAYEFVGRGNFGFSAGLLNASGGLAGGGAILTAGYYRDTIGIPNMMLAGAGMTMLFAIALIVAVRKGTAVES
jgi:MFS family permease